MENTFIDRVNLFLHKFPQVWVSGQTGYTHTLKKSTEGNRTGKLKNNPASNDLEGET